MTPDWRLLADRVDVTARMRDRLISLSVTDEAGLESDALEVVLDNRDMAIAMPRTGAELDLSLGFLRSGLTRVGLFTVDEVRSAGPVRTLTIAAKAADVTGAFKAARTKSWHDTSLGTILSEIAAANGLAPAIAPELASVPIPHLDQTAESDMALVTRLARQYDAVGKPAHGRLVFAPRGAAKTITGKPLATIALSPADGISSWSSTWSERGEHGSVVAYWHNPATGERVPVTAGAGEPKVTLPHSHPDADRAGAAAATKLAALKRGKGTVTLDIAGGRIDVTAEARLSLSGLDSATDGLWTVTKVTHRLSPSGLLTSLEGETVA